MLNSSSILRRQAWKASRPLSPFVAALIGFAPLLCMTLTWLPEGQALQSGVWVIKALSLPCLAAELAVVALAILHPCVRMALPSPAIALSLLALIALAFATANIVAPDSFQANLRTTIWMIHLAFGWALYALIRSDTVDSTDLTNALLVGLLAVCPALIVFTLLAPHPETLNWTNDLPGFDNMRRVGYYAAPLIALALASLGEERRRLAFLTATCGTSIVLWSGTRGAIFAIFVAYALAAYVFAHLRSRRALQGVAASVTLAIVLALLLGKVAPDFGIGRMLDAGASDSGRVELWRQTVIAIAQRPWFGHGEGQAHVLLDFARGSNYHPHNLLLQILLAWGVVGLLLLALPAFRLARHCFQQARARAEALPFFLAAFTLLVYSGIDGTLFHVQAAALFVVAAGACAAVCPSPNEGI